YFSGIPWGGGERLFALILPAKGEPFFVCPAFERDRAEEQIGLSPFAGSGDIRTWEEDESPYLLVAEGLRDHGLSSGRLSPARRPLRRALRSIGGRYEGRLGTGHRFHMRAGWVLG
ncbi:MAG: hypothetical protein ACLQBL_20640, partial [Polyangiaceae bacterium]